ncbi:MAG: transporter substrate-binding domain-containing protein [Dehalococcoidia bacterium]
MARPIVVAVDHLNPPFVQARDEAVEGFTVDVVRAAYERVGWEVEFRPVDGPVSQLIFLAAGSVDAAADITVTERRRAWFAFSHHYHVEELMVFGLRGGALWPGFRHFTGRLAVKANSYVQEYLIRHYPRLPLTTVGSTEEELDAVRAGQARAFAATRETGLALIAGGEAADLAPEGAPFGPAPLALAALQDNEDRVITPFNAGLDALVHDGALDALRRRWLHAFAHA